MIHALLLLYCRDTLLAKTAGETFDTLPSLITVEKISSASIK